DLLDVRFRRALFHGVDRSEIAETAAAGAAHVINSTTHPDSALGKAVEGRAIHYNYDPAQAQALLAEMGWQKDADGILVKDRQRLQLSYRAGAGLTDGNLIFPVLQQQYRRIGIDLQISTAPSSDLEAGATFPGLSFRGLPD